MKKYKCWSEELGYEQIIEADDEQDAEVYALVHCKENLQEYIDMNVEEVNETEEDNDEPKTRLEQMSKLTHDPIVD